MDILYRWEVHLNQSIATTLQPWGSQSLTPWCWCPPSSYPWPSYAFQAEMMKARKTLQFITLQIDLKILGASNHSLVQHGSTMLAFWTLPSKSVGNPHKMAQHGPIVIQLTEMTVPSVHIMTKQFSKWFNMESNATSKKKMWQPLTLH